jgi:hypothetical protein
MPNSAAFLVAAVGTFLTAKDSDMLSIVNKKSVLSFLTEINCVNCSKWLRNFASGQTTGESVDIAFSTG